MVIQSFLNLFRSNHRRRRTGRNHMAEVLEVRTLLTAEPFQDVLLYATTAMPVSDPTFTYQSAEWDNDGFTDLMLIQRSGTASGMVEVSVYSTAFSSFDARNAGQANAYTALLPVAMASSNADWDFRIDNWGGGSKPDLFAIHKANTTSGFVEVTIFTGESNFASGPTAFQTSLPTADRDWVFDLGHYNNDGLIDLFAIRRNGEFSTEVSVASGAGASPSTAFSTLLLQTPTILPHTDDRFEFVVADLENDSIPELVVIQKVGTASGRLEISVLPAAESSLGAAPFRWFSTRTTSRISEINKRDWSFDAAYFNSPFAVPNDGVVDLVSYQRDAYSGVPDLHFFSGRPSYTTASFDAKAVPSSALFTSVAATTNGLVGSYVNSSLRAVASQADWKTSQTIIGSRVDQVIDFNTSSLGTRAAVNVTGGTDNNWDFFSVQWDGYVSIPADGVRLRTNNSDGSRLWIDVNGDGQFDSAGSEFLNNGWGKGRDVTLGPASVQLKNGLVRVRLQFEEAFGPNAVQLLWDFAPTVVPATAYFRDAAKTAPGIVGSYVNSSLRDPAAPPDWRQGGTIQISGTRNDPAIDFPFNSFGSRSSVGLTHGFDPNWDNFSVQWDGFVVIPANGIRLFTKSDDGSRLWIDVNGDGVFANSATELLNNGWATGQATTLSGASTELAAGTYAIRMQYEDGSGSNSAQLLWDYNPIPVSSSRITGTSSSAEQRPTIFWTPATGAAGYEIWVDNLSTNTSAVVRSTTVDTWFTPTMDLGIGQYAAWVRSINLDGVRSAWSLRSTFKIDPAPVINPVSLIFSVARPSISWNPQPGAARYDVWVNNLSTQQSQFIRNTNVTGTSWSSVTDMPIGRYRIWVRGLDAKGGGTNWSKAADFVVATAPVPVSPVQPTFERAPVLTWAALAGALNYRVILKNSNSGAIVHDVGGITGTTFAVPQNLTTGYYKWWVTAYSPDGYGSPNPIVTDFYVGGRPIVLSPAGDTTSTRPEITWTPVTGAATYNLWVNRLDVPTTGVINVTGLTEARYTPPAQLQKGSYRIWVQAVSTTNEVSPWSFAIDFRIV